jgi:hypothetical protein
MGNKLTETEIEEFVICNPNEGFDTCHYCNGVEQQNSMLSFDNSDVIICEECNDGKFEEIDERLTENIDNVFVLAHELFDTDSGDITPYQSSQLYSLKKQMFDLILEQVKQNL